MDFDFLKDRYDFELARQENLTSALTLPVGILTGPTMVKTTATSPAWASFDRTRRN